MSSKQQKAKDSQGYIMGKAIPVCSNCKHFGSEEVPVSYAPGYSREGKLRCLLGGFAVKKTATCKIHEFK